MVVVGAVALAGGQLLPAVAFSGLQVRFFGLASLLIVIGLGLLLVMPTPSRGSRYGYRQDVIRR